MRRFFLKTPGGLVPAYDEDAEWLTKKKTGALLEVNISEPRNQGLHKKWWSLVSFLAENSDRFPTAEHASKYMLIRLGYCTWVRGQYVQPLAIRSSDIPIADSISFAKMDDDEFSALYSKACDLLCEIIPQVADENIRNVLANYAGIGAGMT